MCDRREAEQAAMVLLSSREHSRTELLRKLKSRGYETEVIDPVLLQLEESGYLSDERFAEQYIQMRIRKGYGPLRIRSELKERGISRQLIADRLDESDLNWRDQLRKSASQKFGDKPMADNKERGRRARFLEYRGFPATLIRDYLFDE